MDYSLERLTTGEAFVTLDEAKRHLVLSDSDHDHHVFESIIAACRWIENYTGRFFTPTDLRLSANGFCDHMRLRHKPVQEIVSVEYDTDDAEGLVLDAANYEVDPFNGVMRRSFSGEYPSTRDHWNSVRITYRCGYYTGNYSEVPGDVKAACLLVVGDLFENRERQQTLQLYENHTASMILNKYRVML